MNIYEQPSRWKLILVAGATLIVIASLLYTNMLTRDIAEQERRKVKLWANAYKNLNTADENTDIGFLFEVIKNNETVPVILTDAEGKIQTWRNLDSSRAVNDPYYLEDQLASMQKGQPHIEIETLPGQTNYIYYKDSFLLVRLKYYPFLQLAVISIFLTTVFVAFRSSKSAEQNRVWVGMAKETAHQLGTPISSLVAWVEHLKETSPKDAAIIQEIEKDIGRLELVADRFSKIGSKPTLENKNIIDYLNRSLQYIQNRASDKVHFSIKAEPEVMAMINPALFEWVFENLLKNALDAMNGVGSIEISVFSEDKEVVIDVKDSGKGIPKSKFNTVFEPGYSTKKRGWGLGLTLTKRIVEKYHAGKIFVKESEPEAGTTFRIILPLSPAIS